MDDEAKMFVALYKKILKFLNRLINPPIYLKERNFKENYLKVGKYYIRFDR